MPLRKQSGKTSLTGVLYSALIQVTLRISIPTRRGRVTALVRPWRPVGNPYYKFRPPDVHSPYPTPDLYLSTLEAFTHYSVQAFIDGPLSTDMQAPASWRPKCLLAASNTVCLLRHALDGYSEHASVSEANCRTPIPLQGSWGSGLKATFEIASLSLAAHTVLSCFGEPSSSLLANLFNVSWLQFLHQFHSPISEAEPLTVCPKNDPGTSCIQSCSRRTCVCSL